MPKIPELVPVSDLRQDVAAVLERLQSSGEPLVITQRGRAAAVLIGIDAYQRLEQERELLELFAKGEREIAEGCGADLDEVLTDADALLDDD